MGEARIVPALGLRLIALMALLAVPVACAQSTGTARGVVVSVEGSIDEVTAFTILSAGEEMRLVPVDDVEYEFALPHLREHLRTGEPVLVTWELMDNVRFVVSLTDG